MNLRDIEAQAKALAPILRDYVGKALESLGAKIDGRINELEKGVNAKIDAIPDPESVVLRIVNGFDVSGELSKYLESEESQKTINNIIRRNHADPISLETVENMVSEAVKTALSAIPAPKDGKDALQIEIKPRIDEGKMYERGTFARHNGGLWRAYECTDGMRGWECIVDGVCATDIEQVDDRNIVNIVTMASGKSFRTPITLPTMIYRNVWKDGSYQKGDVVTFGGCAWHCNEDTDTKPGEGSKAWTLAVKKGRDGKSV